MLGVLLLGRVLFSRARQTMVFLLVSLYDATKNGAASKKTEPHICQRNQTRDAQLLAQLLEGSALRPPPQILADAAKGSLHLEVNSWMCLCFKVA